MRKLLSLLGLLAILITLYPSAAVAAPLMDEDDTLTINSFSTWGISTSGIDYADECEMLSDSLAHCISSGTFTGGYGAHGAQFAVAAQNSNASGTFYVTYSLTLSVPSPSRTASLRFKFGGDSGAFTITDALSGQESHPIGDNPVNIRSSFASSGEGGYYEASTFEANLYISTTGFYNPPIDCDTDYYDTSMLVNALPIDPVIETPVGEPTDYQLYDHLIAGQRYHLTASGTWNDGTNDDDDFALSVDEGTTWTPLELFATENQGCLADDGGIIFVAPMVNPEMETILMIRVNDTAGNFADNTEPEPESDPLIWSLALVEIALPFACDDQFTVSATVLYSGSLPPDDSDVIAETSEGQAATFTAGAYYMIQTGGGPFYNGDSPDPQYGIDLQLSSGWASAVEDNETPGISCVLKVGNNYQIYYQAQDAVFLHLRVTDGEANDGDNDWSNNTGEDVTYSIYEAELTKPFLDTCTSKFELSDLLGSNQVDARADLGVEMTELTEALNKPADDIDQTVDRYYSVEVTLGPWKDSNLISSPQYIYSYAAEVGYDNPNDSEAIDWYYINDDDSDFFVCATQLDEYHYRAYFQANNRTTIDPNGFQDVYKYRVHDLDLVNDYTDNQGILGYNTYATNYFGNNIPETGPITSDACDMYTLPALTSGSATVSASDSAGELVPFVPETGGVFAIETTGGPWYNNGGDPLYDIQLSDDGGNTWAPIWQYPGARCAALSGDDYMIVYLTAMDFRVYKFRVNDEAENFTDNTGSISIQVYDLSTGDEGIVTPPGAWTTCGDNYEMRPLTPDAKTPTTSSPITTAFQVITDFIIQRLASLSLQTWSAYVNYNDNMRTVPVKSASGLGVVPNLQPGDVYAIQTAGGPWYPDFDEDPNDQSWSVQISDDNGDTWEDFTAYSESFCVLEKNQYNLVLFSVPEDSGGYRLRVDDSGEDYVWMDNAGGMNFLLYTVTAIDGSVIVPPGTGHVNTRSVFCDGACPAPQTILFGMSTTIPEFEFSIGETEIVSFPAIPFGFQIPDPGQWIAWLLCRLQQFFTWCPMHTDAVMALFGEFTDYEPFATINDIFGLLGFAISEINSRTWPEPFALGGGGNVFTILSSQVERGGELYFDTSNTQSEPIYIDGVGGTLKPWSTAACGQNLINMIGVNKLVASIVSGACWSQAVLLSAEFVPFTIVINALYFAGMVVAYGMYLKRLFGNAYGG